MKKIKNPLRGIFIRVHIMLLSTNAFMLNSCLKSTIDPPDNDINNTTQYFNYRTTREFPLNIDLSKYITDGGIIQFSVYSGNPIITSGGWQKQDSSAVLVRRGLTNESGRFSGSIVIPSYVKGLYIYSKTPGIPCYIKGSVGNSITFEAPSKNYSSLFTNKTIISPNTYSLATWDSLGRSNNLNSTRNIFGASLIADIEASLPVEQSVPDSHPEYINHVKSSIVITDSCQLEVSFAHQFSGNRNTLCYYWYPTGQPPTSLNNVRKEVVFPNMTIINSGGEMYSGDNTTIKYWDGSSYQDKFPPGITIDFCLLVNAYDASSKSIGEGEYLLSTYAPFNSVGGKEGEHYAVVLQDDINKLFVIGFEDLYLNMPGCDQDYTDNIFIVTPVPYSAINTTGFATIQRSIDSDDDGVCDIRDEFPNDPEIAFTNYYPGKGVFGTLLFESNWPEAGDYDLNDVVCDYNITQRGNIRNKLVKAEGEIHVRASGSHSLDGFAFQLGISPNLIDTAFIQGSSFTGNTFTIGEFGLEQGQTYATFALFDNIKTLFNNNTTINTEIGKPIYNYRTIRFMYKLKEPQNISSVGIPPYNPYVIIGSGNGNRGKEVHLFGEPPSNKADLSLFSTGIDMSNLAISRFYQASNNMPFALHIPQSFSYPIEGQSIVSAYKRFNYWRSSNGESFSNWYKIEADKNLIYNK